MSAAARLLPLLAAVLAGCASPFHATWYWMEGPRGGGIYLALVNTSRDPQTVRQLVVNPERGMANAGWRLDLPQPASMEPGQLLVTRLDDYRRDGQVFARCQVPAHVFVLQAPDQAPVRADLDGTMPSLLPLSWQPCGRQSPGSAGHASTGPAPPPHPADPS